MLTSSQTLGWWIQKYGSIQDSRNIGGVVPAYPIFIFIGMLVAIIAIIVEMKIKKIPLNELYWGILITIPTALIGATIFGKLFMIGQKGGIPASQWFHIFFFWEPGMSIFGGLIIGGLCGLWWFSSRSRDTRISLWVYADLIIPNILLGQAIGRWGNMYNHEILTNFTVDYDSLKWLVPGIRDKLFYWDSTTLSGLDYLSTKTAIGNVWTDILKDGKVVGHKIVSVYFPGGEDWAAAVQQNLLKDPDKFMGLINSDNWQELASYMYNGGSGNGWLDVKMDAGIDTSGYEYYLSKADYETIAKDLCAGLKFHAPLFLYESLANIALWLILTFIVPNLSRWFQLKGKYPWDITPKAYPGWYNKKIKEMPLDEIESWSVQRPIKYKKTKDGKYTISFWEAWNKAYYLYEPSDEEFDELVQRQDERNDYNKSLRNSLIMLKQKHKSDLYRLNENFERRSKNFSKQDVRYVELHEELVQNIKQNKVVYREAKKNLKAEIGGWRKAFEPKPDAEKLENVYNPHHFWILRSGVVTGGYIFGSLLIRIILEAFRRPDEYFIQNGGAANFIVIAIMMIIGLAIIFIAQFIAPYKYREAGWLYEKSY